MSEYYSAGLHNQRYGGGTLYRNVMYSMQLGVVLKFPKVTELARQLIASYPGHAENKSPRYETRAYSARQVEVLRNKILIYTHAIHQYSSTKRTPAGLINQISVCPLHASPVSTTSMIAPSSMASLSVSCVRELSLVCL